MAVGHVVTFVVYVALVHARHDDWPDNFRVLSLAMQNKQELSVCLT